MQDQWIDALAGGTLAGLASVGFLLVNGRITGISGILGGLIDGSGAGNRGERAAYLAGLVAIPGLYVAVSGGVATNATGNAFLLVAGGLLVGFGARIANGCISGHGLCGTSRLSPRSFAAMAGFTVAGVAAATLIRYLGV